MIMLIRLRSEGGRLSSCHSSGRSLFGDFIFVRFSFFYFALRTGWFSPRWRPLAIVPSLLGVGSSSLVVRWFDFAPLYLVESPCRDHLFQACLGIRCVSLTWKFCAFRSPSSLFRSPSDWCYDSRYSSFALSIVTVAFVVTCFLAMASLSSSSSMNSVFAGDAYSASSGRACFGVFLVGGVRIFFRQVLLGRWRWSFGSWRLIAAIDPSAVTVPLIIMLIRLLGGGGRLSSLRSSGRSLFGDFISVRSLRVGSLFGDVLRSSCKCLHSIVECSFLLWNSQYLVGSSSRDHLFQGNLGGRCVSLTWKLCAFRSPSSLFLSLSDRCRDSRHSSFALSFVMVVLVVACFLPWPLYLPLVQ
ncbi:hypothetical protein F2Q70_00022781 [Brassica cretica]|uniref:Transmembrane protein n=1 Tax=Brassica cretica TaxID=69181 RepID=A0A8S9GTJ8_BRACR|nr:hypothetical protein F2Q70_00022781 [Brassica cretica]